MNENLDILESAIDGLTVRIQRLEKNSHPPFDFSHLIERIEKLERVTRNFVDTIVLPKKCQCGMEPSMERWWEADGDGKDRYRIQCSCGMRTDNVLSEQEAVRIWNGLTGAG